MLTDFFYRQIIISKVLFDVIAAEVDIAGDGLAQLVHPLIPLAPVGAHQGVHAEHVHAVVVGEGGLLLDPVPESLVVNDVVAAHQTRKVKGVVSEIHKVGIKRVPYENCFVQRENEYV